MDTIAAISTAAGVSAIGILRISGEEALRENPRARSAKLRLGEKLDPFDLA